MTTDLIKPDLSKDTTGPFVTRDGRKAVYVPTPKPIEHRYPFAFEVEDEQVLVGYTADGKFRWGDETPCSLDIFLAPKEPKTVFVNWYESGPGDAYNKRTSADAMAEGLPSRLALLQLEVDDQGVPVDGSVVKRVAT